jgi:hypothetical protein
MKRGVFGLLAVAGLAVAASAAWPQAQAPSGGAPGAVGGAAPAASPTPAGSPASSTPATPAPAAPGARPDQADRMQFTWVGEAGECRDRCRAWVAASGRLTETTVADFDTFRQGLDLRGATVVIESTGGLVEAGLALGRAFRRLEVVTMVGHTVLQKADSRMDSNGERRGTVSPRATCASMCVFAFLGGVRRHVPLEARILVHQIWPSKLREDAMAGSYSAGHMMRIQRELGQIGRYTVDMGAEIELFELAMRIPPWESLRALTRDELRRLRVHSTEIAPVPASAGPPDQAAQPAQRVALASPTANTPGGWTLIRLDGRSVVTRRHPLTIEGREIGSFELSLTCGNAPDTYQILYSEKRMAEATGPDRLNGVRMSIQREAVPLKIESSAVAASEVATAARGAVPAPLARALTEGEPRSLLVETVTAARQRTSIRVGPVGLAEGLREVAVSCRK